MYELWLVAPLSALVSIVVGLYFYNYVNKQDPGTEKMQEIASAIREGANAFLNREYKTLAVFVSIVAVFMFIFLPSPIWSNPDPLKNVATVAAYIFGSVCSATAGFLGMNISTKANTRAASSAREVLNKAFTIGFRGGAVMGMAVVGLGLLGVSVVYWATGDPEVILGFSFGASSLALFAKAGGGI